jgi:hypothetical protein
MREEAMKQLSEECRRFIVQAIAVSIPLQEVSRAVQAYFMVALSEEELRLYDPTQDLSPDWLNPYLIRLFAATRECYLTGIDSWADECAGGHVTKDYRLGLLQRSFDTTWDGNNIAQLSPRECWLVMGILEEAAKVSNDWYEQYGDASTDDAQMIRLITLGWDIDELLKDYTGDDS